ncbi:MAG: bifunctional phosphopantothenoylcysteine decarboxylase/phosphopantothenate--cysteine ligase CoaBC [Deltaproteobacteria bacterium]|nr:MAG: bifunctional phosphopantothenoylcysteine decarboxylase/phosphopantothenate--cysteine ligase CoaBC [Deltaproteobacteria bacterium]
MLTDKKILLAVSGGIACYKSIEIMRQLQKKGAGVRVVMTPHATAFVQSMTFAAISGHPVYQEMFADETDGVIRHIDLAGWADAVVIAPATANVIGKLACGIADDALTTLMMAVRAPVMVCPSMNTTMYESRAVQRNIDQLAADGFHLIEPDAGELACGVTGAGRLPEPGYIVNRLERLFYPKDFQGKKVLITAGPTREAIDPVRYISNHSSGKMGYALAGAAEYRGADVTLVSGPTAEALPPHVKRVDVESAREMYDAVFDHLSHADVLIKVAAVADYRPAEVAEHKLKKSDEDRVLTLKKNPDILKSAGTAKAGPFLVGFAAETRNLKTYATKKIREKNLDMIVGNLVNAPGSGFGSDTNTVTLFYKDGTEEALPNLSKQAVAHALLDRIGKRLSEK